MTENEIYKMDDRRLINFFEDSILQDPTLETTLNNLTALTALLDRGLFQFSVQKLILFSAKAKNILLFSGERQKKNLMKKTLLN